MKKNLDYAFSTIHGCAVVLGRFHIMCVVLYRNMKRAGEDWLCTVCLIYIYLHCINRSRLIIVLLGYQNANFPFKWGAFLRPMQTAGALILTTSVNGTVKFLLLQHFLCLDQSTIWDLEVKLSAHVLISQSFKHAFTIFYFNDTHL